MVTEVAPRHHSRISPSMMGRVEQCTASHFLLPERVVRETNESAAYGTAGHEIAEKWIANPNLLSFELLGMEVKADGFTFEVDMDMLEIIKPYVEYCWDLSNRAAEWHLEQRVELLPIYTGKLPRVAGLIDYAAIMMNPVDPYVEIVDLKTGRQPVWPDAVQTLVYGIMVIDAFPKIEAASATPLKTTIIQPVADGQTIKSKLWTREELDVARKRIMGLFKRIERGEFRYVFGDHCRFCPILPTCPKARAVALDAALAEVVPTPELMAKGDVTIEDLNEALRILPMLKVWEKAVMGLAESYLNAGGALDQAKLVRKRSVRKWRDGVDPIPHLEKHGVDPYAEKKVISPTQAEKRLPKLAYKAIEGMVEKPAGGLTLALGEDSRTEVEIGATLRRAVENSSALEMIKAQKENAERNKT